MPLEIILTPSGDEEVDDVLMSKFMAKFIARPPRLVFDDAETQVLWSLLEAAGRVTWVCETPCLDAP